MQMNNDYYIVVSLSILIATVICTFPLSIRLLLKAFYLSVANHLLFLLCFCVLFSPPLFHDNTLFNRFVTHYVTGDSL